jgi:FKBP-type peptidyl-prolyl cis-trans isomerase FklB
MKSKFLLMGFSAAMISFSACQNQSGMNTEVTVETELDQVSYGIGVDIANNFKQGGLAEVNIEVLAAGMRDVLTGAELKLTEEESKEIIASYMQAKQAELTAAAVGEGETFLAENATREGITTLESGLQYEVMTAGTGALPTITDQVTTHYHGTLINGDVFDSSVERGEPATFPVNGVIAGWTEALQLMPVGSKWKLFVPAHLAYGERGAGAKIGPNTTLVFEVELISIGG